MFNFRVLRCPACSATLPVGAHDTIVECEYCDARVEVARSKPAPPASPAIEARHAFSAPEASAPRSTYSAKPRLSGFVWFLFSLALTVGIAGVVLSVVAAKFDRYGVWDLLAMMKPGGQREVKASTPPRRVATASKTKRGAKKKARSKSTHEPAEGSEASADAEGDDDSKTQTMQVAAAATKKTSSTKAKTSGPVLTGPVLTASDASKALAPGVLACMREHKVHDILAYMGNSTVGPVKVLGDRRSRVDGMQAKIKGTALGKCMDKAASTTRVRAFKSNYVRFALTNDSVPDPLAHLPAKLDRKAVDGVIATADAKVKTCAAKHGEEGAKEVFYFVIDGPTGKATSVRGSYLSKAFHRCALPHYEKLEFPRAKQWGFKVTKHLQL